MFYVSMIYGAKNAIVNETITTGEKMRYLLLSAFIGSLITLPASAIQPPVRVDEYLLNCSKTNDAESCYSALNSFASNWAGAWNGDYQAQRNVAFCFSTGCNGAVEKRLIEGCAWRMVIMARRDVKAGFDKSDTFNYQVFCGSRVIPTTSRRPALDYAERVFMRIYKKQMPLDRLFVD